MSLPENNTAREEKSDGANKTKREKDEIEKHPEETEKESDEGIRNGSQEVEETHCIESKEFQSSKPFKIRGRAIKSKPVTNDEENKFMMDVPEAWGVAADGSMMEVFNKLEIKK